MYKRVALSILAVISMLFAALAGVVYNCYVDISNNIDIRYENKKVRFPSDASFLKEDGWYIYDVSSNGTLSLKNGKYADAIVTLHCENFSGSSLEDISSSLKNIEFYVPLDSINCPDVTVNGLSFGDTQEELYEKWGSPVADEAMQEEGVSYHYVYFSNRINGVVSVYYEVLLENGVVSGIQISMRSKFG